MPRQNTSRRKLERRSVKAMACIEARGLRKVFGTTVALDGINLHVEEGRILGLIGPNGAGKTTALNAILGLTSYQGQLKVLGRDPWIARDQLMRDVSFIADVAVLPRWMRVSQMLDYVAGVHPRFDRAKAEGFLSKTTIKRTSKVRELSKGMVAQLHLALVMAIDAKLLVLDEPTLGLDILYRKQFYDTLLNDYFDRSRTIVVTTHQVEEIQDVLTDLMFIDRGRIVLECSMEEFDARYLEVMVNPEQLAAGRAFTTIGLADRRRAVLLLDDPAKQRIAIEMPYDIAAMMMMLTAFIVALFYCLDALHGERRDRSILFWKSLPVSDLTAVLSKVTVPLVVIPLVAFAITVCVQLIILLITSVVLLMHGVSPATTLAHVSFFRSWVVLLYGWVALSLWDAPFYGWLLLVSGWARRATVLL